MQKKNDFGFVRIQEHENLTGFFRNLHVHFYEKKKWAKMVIFVRNFSQYSKLHEFYSDSFIGNWIFNWTHGIKSEDTVPFQVPFKWKVNCEFVSRILVLRQMQYDKFGAQYWCVFCLCAKSCRSLFTFGCCFYLLIICLK